MADTRALDIQVSMNTAQLNADIGKAKGLVATFTSEIKRSDAEMKAFGKSSDGLASKKEALTKKFEAQGKQMELLTKAYDEQIKAGNDTSKQTLKLERDINNLAGQMAKTEGDIDGVNQELADYADVSGKAGTSTVDLYNKIGEADQKLKTYESELKKANSEVKVFGESNETLGNKLVALNNVYDGQKEKMSALTAAYDREVEKSGAASVSAQKLSQEMNTLEASMNVTKGEIDSTSTSLDNLGDVAAPTAGQIDQVQASLKALVMDKVVEYLDNIADKMLEIGANAVSTAADIQAHDALFKQVFDNMSDGAGGTVEKTEEAYGKVKELAEYSGRIPTALEAGFLRMSQQYMSIGLDAETALDLSTQAMKLSADAAAAYNVELDDAQGKVQSFIKGNNSAGESVGIFARETTMAAFAIEKGYIDVSAQQEQFAADSAIKVAKAQQAYDKVLASGKSTPVDIADAQNKLTKAIAEQDEGLKISQRTWTDQSEAVKQAVRTDYVEYVYGLAQVMGQAGREADEWETSVNNLEEAQRRLNNALGEAALEMLIPIIQGLTVLIMKFVEWFDNLSPAMKKFITIIALVIVAAIKIAVIFGKLSIVAALLNTSVGLLIGSFISMAAPIIAVVAVIGLIIAAILSSETAMEWLRNAWEVTVAFLTDVWNQIAAAVSEVWGNITQWITENQESISKVIERVWDVIRLVIETALAVIVPIIKGAWLAIKFIIVAVWDFLVVFIGTALKIIWDVIEVFLAMLEGDWGLAWEKIKELVGTIMTGILDVIVSAWNGIVDIVTGVLLFLGSVIFGALNGIYTLWMGIWNGIKTFVMATLDAISLFILNGMILIAETLSTWLTNIKTGWSEGWEALKTALSNIWEQMKSNFAANTQIMYDTLVGWLNNIKTWWNNTWQGIKDFFAGIWESVGEILKGIKGPIDSVIGYFNGLWESAKSVFNNIKEKINDTWNSVKNTLSKLNPANLFNAQSVIKVSYDSDPYNPAIGAFNMPTQPLPIFSSAIGSLMSASGSIIGGMNSAFNNLDGIYAGGAAVVVAPQERDDRNQTIMNDRMDRIERLLTMIAEKELHAFLDSREVTSKLYNPMQSEAELREVEKSRTIGVW